MDEEIREGIKTKEIAQDENVQNRKEETVTKYDDQRRKVKQLFYIHKKRKFLKNQTRETNQKFLKERPEMRTYT